MQVTFHNEEFPDGVEFDMGGLLFINGEVNVVSDEQKETFELKNGKTLEEALKSCSHAPGHFVPIEKTEEELVEEKAHLLGVSTDNLAITNPPDDDDPDGDDEVKEGE